MNVPSGTHASPAAVAVALGIVYVVWGSTYLAIGIVVETMPALFTAGLRFALAGVLMGVILAGRSGWRRLRVTRAELGSAALIGLLLPAFGNGLVSVGESMGTPTGVAALLIAAVPLWVVVYRIVSGDRPSVPTWAGVLVGFGGLAWLVLSTGVDGSIPLGPTLIICVASISWSFGSWVQPRLRMPRDPFIGTAWEMLAGGLAMIAMGLGRGETIDVTAWSTRSWVAWTYLVIFGSLVAFTAYIWVLSKAPISLVATYAYVNPVVAIFLGWLILSEPVTLTIVVAATVVVVGVAVVVTSERRPKPIVDQVPPVP